MIEIKKAKIKDGMFLEAEYSERLPDGTTNSIKISSAHVVHDDLRAAFADLDETLAQFTEQYYKGGLLGNVKMTGFVISGSDSSEGVTMLGTRILDSGKNLNITSPFSSWADHDIEREISVCRDEVYAYLFEDKHQPSDQLEMEFNEMGDSVNEESESKPAKKIKGKGKKAKEGEDEKDFIDIEF